MWGNRFEFSEFCGMDDLDFFAVVGEKWEFEPKPGYHTTLVRARFRFSVFCSKRHVKIIYTK